MLEQAEPFCQVVGVTDHRIPGPLQRDCVKMWQPEECPVHGWKVPTLVTTTGQAGCWVYVTENDVFRLCCWSQFSAWIRARYHRSDMELDVKDICNPMSRPDTCAYDPCTSLVLGGIDHWD